MEEAKESPQDPSSSLEETSREEDTYASFHYLSLRDHRCRRQRIIGPQSTILTQKYIMDLYKETPEAPDFFLYYESGSPGCGIAAVWDEISLSELRSPPH